MTTAPRRIEGGGTPETAWIGWPGLTRVPLRPLDHWVAADQRLVVVAPHPDDEILAGGALASLHAQRGGRVRVVAVTDGEASHRGDPGWTASRLAIERRNESAEGLVRLLGVVPEVVRLGLADAAVAARGDELSRRLQQILEPSDCVVTTWRLDGHPDHEATGSAAASACAAVGCLLIEAPVWMWHWAQPDDARVPWAHLAGVAIPPATIARRRLAIAAHASQLGPRGSEGPVLTTGILDRLERRVEYFFVGESR